MIKRITDLEEMKRVAEVGDKIEVSDYGINHFENEGVIVRHLNNNGYNVLFKDGIYGDYKGIDSLKRLLEEYCGTWDNVVLIKEVEDKNINPYDDFDKSIGCKFKLYAEPSCTSDYYYREVTLLNFNPSGSSVFLDKNGKLLIIPTSDIKYMRALKTKED